MARLTLFAVVALFLSCTQQQTTWHKDVAPIVQRKCGTCHEPGGVGPFPLLTLDDWKAVEQPALDAIRSGRMPPFPARQDCADYSPTQALLPSQRAVIEKWLDEGSIEGDPATFKALPDAADRLTRVDLSLPLSEPFTPTQAPDQYRCFLADWPHDVAKFITGYELKPGQKSLVHHADIFFLHPSVAARWQQRDDDAPGPGWECYDIPFSDEGGWIGTWVPGYRGVDFPEGTGLRIEPGAKIYVQVHYNLPAGNTLADVSVLDLRLEDRVSRNGGVQAMSDPRWLTQKTMHIPANEKDVTHSFRADPTMLASLISRNLIDGEPLKLYASTLHMHQLGQSASITLHRADGSTECIADIPKWNFHWQLSYTLKEPIIINPGDELDVTCTWDNTAANQPVIKGTQVTPVNRNWGARTEDEMCVGGIYVSN